MMVVAGQTVAITSKPSSRSKVHIRSDMGLECDVTQKTCFLLAGMVRCSLWLWPTTAGMVRS